MKLSAPALAITAAAIWGAAILVIGSVGLATPGYGEAVLSLVASIYPGYADTGTFADLLIGVLYALVDGLVGGFVFAVLYNKIVDLMAGSTEPTPGPPADET